MGAVSPPSHGRIADDDENEGPMESNARKEKTKRGERTLKKGEKKTQYTPFPKSAIFTVILSESGPMRPSALALELDATVERSTLIAEDGRPYPSVYEDPSTLEV